MSILTIDNLDVIKKFINKLDFKFHFNYETSFLELENENFIQKLSSDEISRLESKFVKPKYFVDLCEIVSNLDLVIIKSPKEFGRSSSAIMALSGLQHSKIYYVDINTNAHTFLSEFSFDYLNSFVMKINNKIHIEENLINTLKTKLKDSKGKLIIIIDDESTYEETIPSNIVFSLADTADKHEVFVSHLNYNLRILSNEHIQKNFNALIEHVEIKNIINSSSLKAVSNYVNRLISMVDKDSKIEDMISILKYSEHSFIEKHFYKIEMDEKIHSIATSLLEFNSFPLFQKEYPILEEKLKDFYPPELDEDDEDESDDENDFNETFEYWKFNKLYIKRLYKDHLKELKKHKQEQEKKELEEKEKTKKETEEEIKNHFMQYKKTTNLNKINAQIYYGQFENSFGLIYKGYVRFTDKEYGRNLLSYVLDDYYVWREPILKWFLNIKISEISNYFGYFKKLIFLANLIKEDFSYFENLENLILDESFENNFRISFILSSIHVKDLKKGPVKKIILSYKDDKNFSKNIIALITCILSNDLVLLDEIILKYKEILDDSDKDLEQKDNSVILLCKAFNFTLKNKVDLKIYVYLINSLCSFFADGSINDYKSLFVEIQCKLIQNILKIKNIEYPLPVLLYSCDDIADKIQKENILNLVRIYIVHSKDIDKTFEMFKEYINNIKGNPDLFNMTKDFLIALCNDNQKLILEKLLFYLRVWKKDMEDADKILLALQNEAGIYIQFGH